MLHDMRALHGYAIETADGYGGRVHDAYVDDRGWDVRYLVVDVTHWPPHRRVLLSPSALTGVDVARRTVRTALGAAQVAGSPRADADKPVSRQDEADRFRYYGFPHYWPSGEAVPYAAAAGVPGALTAIGLETGWYRPGDGDPHLRSLRALTGHTLHALDGDIGHVADFLCDDATWRISHLVAATGWLPGRRVLIPTRWVSWVSWHAHTVDVHLRGETVRLAPAHDGATPPSPDFLARVDAYYGLAPAA